MLFHRWCRTSLY